MTKITDILVGDIFHLNKYCIQLNMLSYGGEYSVPLTFTQIEYFYWIKDTGEIIQFIKNNNGYNYSAKSDSICFDNKKDAQLVTDKLLSLYEIHIIENNS